jgi:hypothetical protein
MAKQPINISWDDLNTRKVDQRLREQQAMTRNRAYARMDADNLPVAKPARASLLTNTIFALTAMGLIGGLLAWSCGFLAQIKPDEQQALDDLRGIEHTIGDRTNGAIKSDDLDNSLALQRANAALNPYFAYIEQPGLSPAERSARLAAIEDRAELKRALMSALSFGLSGMLLAACLGIAEPLTERNMPRVVRNGALGAMLGLIGGIGVSLFVEKLYRAIGGGNATGGPESFAARDVLAHACAWGVLGVFLAAGPGLLMGNIKKVLIGISGGLIGGAIGGALFDPVNAWAGPDISRLVALCTIGVLTGLGTALIENVAKAGWLKVTGGLIAGKQFILYRNPTYIGSGPECQIYLFRDPVVGRRHAALHLIPGGIEIEDLPLGKSTLINGKAITRAKLRHGDHIAIGATTFLFQEKERT